MPALIVDPALQASVIRQFNLKGELAPFNLTENVIPVFDIGALTRVIDPTVVTTLSGSQGVRIGLASGNATIPFSKPVQALFDGGFTINPGAAAVLVDTGALAAGTRTFTVLLNANAIYDLTIEHRNAANTANIQTFSALVGGVGVSAPVQVEFSLNWAANERLRVITGGIVVGTVSAAIAQASFTRSSAS